MEAGTGLKDMTHSFACGEHTRTGVFKSHIDLVLLGFAGEIERQNDAWGAPGQPEFFTYIPPNHKLPAA